MRLFFSSFAVMFGILLAVFTALVGLFLGLGYATLYLQGIL